MIEINQPDIGLAITCREETMADTPAIATYPATRAEWRRE